MRKGGGGGEKDVEERQGERMSEGKDERERETMRENEKERENGISRNR